jgi:hypothetical protein
MVVFFDIVAFYVIFSTYMRSRLLSDKLLALASKEFHEKANSAMETPSDLPDTVINHIAFLNREAFNNGTPKKFYFLLKKYNAGKIDNNLTSKNASVNLFRELRPELQVVLGEITVMWFNLIINRNLFWGALISFELKRLKASKGDLTHSAASLGSSIFPSLEKQFCL